MMKILFLRMNCNADKLLKIAQNFTVVGTIEENKRGIPPELLKLRFRSVGASMFCFDQDKTTLSYKTKQNTCVLLSTFHEKSNINEESEKPGNNLILQCNKRGLRHIRSDV
ncbi:DDE_Tnp_1_7 domain-containing protein [Trichonephila clavata]|uniref:DDE_Tnp_1_7 domain-containing protein n=1 Tax=Trichonephila clavata TaxID=2740835 RepID=A0A8X6LKM0_TRICU|nr:DDE_Tnp_1_7 domain-containing protein [Trichonephila clavata]